MGSAAQQAHPALRAVERTLVGGREAAMRTHDTAGTCGRHRPLDPAEADWLIIVAGHAADVPGAVIGWPSGWLGGVLLAGLDEGFDGPGCGRRRQGRGGGAAQAGGGGDHRQRGGPTPRRG